MSSETLQGRMNKQPVLRQADVSDADAYF